MGSLSWSTLLSMSLFPCYRGGNWGQKRWRHPALKWRNWHLNPRAWPQQVPALAGKFLGHGENWGGNRYIKPALGNAHRHQGLCDSYSPLLCPENSLEGADETTDAISDLLQSGQTKACLIWSGQTQWAWFWLPTEAKSPVLGSGILGLNPGSDPDQVMWP